MGEDLTVLRESRRAERLEYFEVGTLEKVEASKILLTLVVGTRIRIDARY